VGSDTLAAAQTGASRIDRDVVSRYLEEPAGPVAVAAVDGAFAKALSLRAQGEDEDANDLLQDLYAANPENAQIEEALSDSTFGLATTTAARIDARTNPWDPHTEPSEADFVDPGAKERKAHLLIEAEAELAEFIGLEEVKYHTSTSAASTINAHQAASYRPVAANVTSSATVSMWIVVALNPRVAEPASYSLPMRRLVGFAAAGVDASLIPATAYLVGVFSWVLNR
jgi:hypothetical protein